MPDKTFAKGNPGTINGNYNNYIKLQIQKAENQIIDSYTGSIWRQSLKSETTLLPFK